MRWPIRTRLFEPGNCAGMLRGYRSGGASTRLAKADSATAMRLSDAGALVSAGSARASPHLLEWATNFPGGPVPCGHFLQRSSREIRWLSCGCSSLFAGLVPARAMRPPEVETHFPVRQGAAQLRRSLAT